MVWSCSRCGTGVTGVSCVTLAVGSAAGAAVVVVAVVARDRLLELAHAAPERAAHLGQPLRPEEDQDDHQQDEQFRKTDPARHAGRVQRLAASEARNDVEMPKSPLRVVALAATVDERDRMGAEAIDRGSGGCSLVLRSPG